MANPGEKILVLDTQEDSRRHLVELLRAAGYDAEALPPDADGLAAARHAKTGGTDSRSMPCPELRAGKFWRSGKARAATQDVRVILLVAGGAADRALAIDLGADDASRGLSSRRNCWRVCARKCARSAPRSIAAEDGNCRGRAADRAYGVRGARGDGKDEPKDAFSLNRALKIGVMAILVISAGRWRGSSFSIPQRAEGAEARELARRAAGSWIENAAEPGGGRAEAARANSAPAATAPQRDELQQKADRAESADGCYRG